MFNFQGSEIVIILLLALVVLGPEKLPDAMRRMGQMYGELKKMSSGFQQEFRAVIDEPMREVRETANLLRDSTDFTKLQQGERAEKPQSGEMPDMATATPDAGLPVDEPVSTVPFQPEPAPFTGSRSSLGSETVRDDDGLRVAPPVNVASGHEPEAEEPPPVRPFYQTIISGPGVSKPTPASTELSESSAGSSDASAEGGPAVGPAHQGNS